MEIIRWPRKYFIFRSRNNSSEKAIADDANKTRKNINYKTSKGDEIKSLFNSLVTADTIIQMVIFNASLLPIVWNRRWQRERSPSSCTQQFFNRASYATF